jgi:hypothetical protein
MRPIRPIGILPDVVKEKLTESVKCDALHEARRDDAVRVNVVARHVDAAAGDGGDFLK